MRLILSSLLACMLATSAWAQEPPVLPEVATAYEAALATSVTPRRLIDEQRDWLASHDPNAFGAPNDIDRERIAELEARTTMDRAIRTATVTDTLPGECLGPALLTCTSPIGGYLTDPNGTDLAWQMQRGLLPDGETEGHGVVVTAFDPGGQSVPSVWVFGQAQRLPPQYVERAGRRFLVLPARHDFLDDAEDVVFEWSDGARLSQIDTWSWRDDLAERLPPGLTLPRNVAIDMAELTARTPLWLGDGDTDEPTGGEATLRFVLEGDRLVLDMVRVRDPLRVLAVVTPSDVFDYAGRRYRCAGLPGRRSYDTARNEVIQTTMIQLRCTTLNDDGLALKRVYADRPDVLKAIARIETDR
ncbi:hypothetical protein [Brevundimonas sp.]